MILAKPMMRLTAWLQYFQVLFVTGIALRMMAYVLKRAKDEDSIGGYFLNLLHDKAPSELFTQKSDACSLILYAEHEFNASTFTARVCASTLSDIHSCITAAIGTSTWAITWWCQRGCDGDDSRLENARGSGSQ